MGGILSRFLSDFQLQLSEVINPWPFLWKYQATATAGWNKKYEHLGNILEKCEAIPETGKECEEITIIKYKTLTIRIYGKITVDDTLIKLSQWEYYHILKYANDIPLTPIQFVRHATIQHQYSGKVYEFGLVQKGPWKPLKPDSPTLDSIFWVSGSEDLTNVELFNGQTNLYLKVVQVPGGYHVEVADRPLQADPLSRFDLSDPSGTIRLVVDSNYYLKFNRDDHHVDATNVDATDVDATDAVGITVSSAPEFHFSIHFFDMENN